MLIDLHTHTKPWSDDSQLDIPELVHVARQAGLDAICLTEHDWFREKESLAKLSQEHDFLILPAVETNTDDGHFLVFGVEKYTFGMHRTEFLRDLVDEAEGAMILAHPYRRNYHNGDDVYDAVEKYYQKPFFHLVDAIEVLNGRASDMENKFSQELCRRLNLNGIGGSDAHSTSNIPSYATLFERKIANVEELIAELKAGRFRAVDIRQGS
ncbi:PHP domain-containing protein [Chloroflexota bacterium]